MPLTTRTLVNLVGLNTEASPVDPQATPPNSLYDSYNIIFSKAGQIVSRKGIPVWADLTSVTSGYLPLTISGMCPANTEESAFLVMGQTATNGGQAVYVTPTINDRVVQRYSDTITAGIRAQATPTSASFPDDTAEWTSYSAAYWNSNNHLYVTAKNGVFRGEPSGTTLNRYLKRVTPPIPSITNTGSDDYVSSPTLEEAWLQTGYKCRVVCVVVEYLENGTPVESPISSEYVFENIGIPSAPKLFWKVDCHNVRNLSRTYLEVYRTRSYRFDAEYPEIEFKKCRAVPLDNTVYVQKNGSNGDIYETKTGVPLPLFANDDLIASSETLYASANADGSNTHVNCTLPAANDATVYKGYTVYAGVKTPPYISVTATGIGATAGSFNVANYPGGSAVTTALTLQDNATFMTSTSAGTSTYGVMSAADYTFKGVRVVSGGAVTAVNLCIRPVDPSNATAAAYKCTVPFFAKIEYKLMYLAQENGTVARIRPVKNIFDLSRFVKGKGCFAVVDTTGIVRDIVTYDDYEQIPGATTYIEFYGAQSKASFDASSASSCWKADSTTAGTYYLYPLTTADTNNLPIYPISSDAASTASYDLSFSLLPTYYVYPSSKFMDTPVGVTGTVGYASTRITCTPIMFGLLWKDSLTRMDRAVKKLVQDHNINRTYKYPYMVYTGVPFNFLIMGSYAGSHTLSNTETNSGNYDAIIAYLSGSSTFTFDEFITTSSTTTNFAEDVDIPNGLIFAKLNKPECVPLSAVLAPARVGQDDYRIQRVAVNNDQLYVFKEKEGIFRVQVVEGTVIPEISSVSVVDNTIWLVGDATLQEVQESVYFLSNKGVLRLSNGQLTNLSRSIESQIKDAIARESNVNAIRSFKNEFRRQYGIYFPTSGKCFVYDCYTEQWGLWGNTFSASYAMTDGRQMFTKVVNSQHVIVKRNSYAGGGWDAAADQYDHQVAVTSTSTGNTAVFTPSGLSGTYLANLGTLAQDVDFTREKPYYKTAGGTVYPMTYVSSSTSGSGSITCTFDNGISKPDGNVGGVAGTLVIGVNSMVQFNRFWASSSPGVTFDGQVVPSSPLGAMTLVQFAETHLHTLGSHTGVSINFEADSSSPDFSESVSPESFSVTLPAFSDIIRVAVPRNQARGRWIMTQIKHSYPYEKFVLTGLGYVFKDSSTFRTKARIT